MTTKGKEQTTVLGKRLTAEEIAEIQAEDDKRGPDRDGITLTSVQVHRRRLLREVHALNEEIETLKARYEDALRRLGEAE